MFVIIVNKPTAFFCRQNKVVIYDKHKRVFYSHSPRNGLFNLPVGIYFTNNLIHKRGGKPLQYKLTPLKPDRKSKLTRSDLVVKFGNNPNKATINHSTGHVLIDKRYFDSLNQAGQRFVIEHEIGHLQQKTEYGADIYASNRLLEAGYNPSQIAAYLETGLRKTKRNQNRCDVVVTTTAKANRKK